MTGADSEAAEVFAQILDPANRHDPYPLYARLRETPVAALGGDFHAVSTHPEIAALLHDPRTGKDERGSSVADAVPRRGEPRSFLSLDPPDHDRLRRLVVRQFTPARVASMHQRISVIVDALLDAQHHHDHFDVVDDFAYPLPVTVICEMLGVPREDEERFHVWADVLAHNLDPDPGDKTTTEAANAAQELATYTAQLMTARRTQPTDDLLSALATGTGERMDDPDLVVTAILLLIAGHETTVNLIANGMLTLLRHPDELERLRRDPERGPRVVAELLRYEPPVQFIPRFAHADIDIAGTTIPRGAGIRLMLAAGNRDPQRFRDPDLFAPCRADNEHFGFGGGIHFCVGAPLARVEGEMALAALARRLVNPHLLTEPPPYRPNAVLRGPQHLEVGFDGVAE
jgi:cytochrome P450